MCVRSGFVLCANKYGALKKSRVKAAKGRFLINF